MESKVCPPRESPGLRSRPAARARAPVSALRSLQYTPRPRARPAATPLPGYNRGLQRAQVTADVHVYGFSPGEANHVRVPCSLQVLHARASL